MLGVAGVDIARRYVGHYATSMEMAGCSLSLLFLDAELESLLDAPTDCPFWPRAHVDNRDAGGGDRAHRRRLEDIRDRLNDADSKLGDGDTGMTVARMIEAVRQCAAEFRRMSGRARAVRARVLAGDRIELGAVVAMALSAAGRAARHRMRSIARVRRRMLAAAVAIIQERSGAAPGDKTVLDSILAIQDALPGRRPRLRCAISPSTRR